MYNLLTENELSILKEGVFKTYNLEVLCELLDNHFGKPGQVIKNRVYFSHYNCKEKKLNEDMFDWVRLIAEQCGYKICQFRCIDKKESIHRFTSTESCLNFAEINKDRDFGFIIEPVRKDNDPLSFQQEILFHVTPKRVWESKISKTGLSPRSNNKLYAHPERVYFATVFEQAKSMISQLSKHTKKKDSKGNEINNDYVILQVDMKGLNLQQYKDDFSPIMGFCYVTGNIPPNRLKVVEEVKTS